MMVKVSVDERDENCAQNFNNSDGMSPQKFYKSNRQQQKSGVQSSSSSSNVLKRRLQVACESVKAKRTQDSLAFIDNRNVLKAKVKQLPTIYRVFQKQCDALEFAQKINLRVFSFETDSNGRRNFITCHPNTMWKLIKAKPPDCRHEYEVIGENMNSKVKNEQKLKKVFLFPFSFFLFPFSRKKIVNQFHEIFLKIQKRTSTQWGK
jgi:hypothetical protein